MDAETFASLALRVIAGETGNDDRQALDAALLENPARRADFEQMRISHDVLRALAPVSEAIHASEPSLPPYRLNELRTAVRQHFGPGACRASSPAGSRLFVRWFLAGGFATMALLFVAFLTLSDQVVEVGLYQVGQVRGENEGVSPADLQPARMVVFEQDAPFDQWQKTLAWNEHAKIWADNEKDLLHILSRDKQGHLVERTEPLASTDAEQRTQIVHAVEALKK